MSGTQPEYHTHRIFTYELAHTRSQLMYMQLRKRTRAALEASIHYIRGDLYWRPTSTTASNVSDINLWKQIKTEYSNTNWHAHDHNICTHLRKRTRAALEANIHYIRGD